MSFDSLPNHSRRSIFLSVVFATLLFAVPCYSSDKPSFLKVGTTYVGLLAGETTETFEILELTDGPWIKVRFLKRQSGIRGEYSAVWINTAQMRWVVEATK